MIREEPIAPAPAPPLVMLESSELLGDAREVVIRHGAEFYRLKLTRHGKLILTK